MSFAPYVVPNWPWPLDDLLEADDDTLETRVDVLSEVARVGSDIGESVGPALAELILTLTGAFDIEYEPLPAGTNLERILEGRALLAGIMTAPTESPGIGFVLPHPEGEWMPVHVRWVQAPLTPFDVVVFDHGGRRLDRLASVLHDLDPGPLDGGFVVEGEFPRRLEVVPAGWRYALEAAMRVASRLNPQPRRRYAFVPPNTRRWSRASLPVDVECAFAVEGAGSPGRGECPVYILKNMDSPEALAGLVAVKVSRVHPEPDEAPIPDAPWTWL